MMSDNIRGAALMAVAVVSFTVNDTFMKLLSEDLPMFQSVFLRSIGTVAFLLLITRGRGQHSTQIAPADRRLIAIRSTAEVLAAFFFLTALFNMPIANATSIMQVMPLSVTLAAAVVFKEPIGWRRMTAIVAGFCGVLLIIKPGTDGFNIYALSVLAAVVSVTVRDLAARRMSRDVPSMRVALSAAVAVLVASGLASLVQPWAPVSAHSGLLLLGAMVFVMSGYIFSVAAMRVGDVGVVSPFRYAAILAAIVLGMAVFDEVPDALTLLGAAIVIGAGVFTLLRNRRTLPKETGVRPR